MASTLFRYILLLSWGGASFLIFFLFFEWDWCVRSNVLSFSSSLKTCHPTKKAAFLKIHKCGSSTVQNIFLRHAYFNRLNVVLPVRGHYLGNPRPFRKEMIQNAPWHHLGYDVFCLHTRWDHDAISDAMGNNTMYVTILREPVALFESVFSYGELEKTYGRNLASFTEALDDPDNKTKNDWRNGVFGRNQMAWDFGMETRDFENETEISELVKRTEKSFNLVMILEKFEESMILLKNLLCWETNQVATIKLNFRKDEEKTALNNEQVKKLKQFLKADGQLYEHFSDLFDRKVAEFGRKRMEEEIKDLRRTVEGIENSCIVGVVSSENFTRNSNKKLFSDRVAAYDVKSTPECRLIGLQELDFIDEIRDLQRKRGTKTLEQTSNTLQKNS